MKIVIVGCGRVGGAIAETYDRNGHEVVILDMSTAAFDRLPSSFRGEALRGDGTDEDILRRAGTEGADVFLALTEGDNRNVMACQLAAEALGVRRVIAKINDPVRAAAYSELGLATLCRTGLMMDAVDDYLGLPKSGLPGMLAPSGTHHAPSESLADTTDAAPAGASTGTGPGTGLGTGPGTGPGMGPSAGAAPLRPAVPSSNREV